MQGDSVLGRWRVERGGDGTGAPSRAAGRKYVPNPRHDVRAARVARDQQGFAYRADRFLPDESGLVVGKPAHALFAYGAGSKEPVSYTVRVVGFGKYAAVVPASGAGAIRRDGIVRENGIWVYRYGG